MPQKPNACVAENLRRWQQSGDPRRWMEAHRGRWGQEDWLALVEALQWSSFWPLDPNAIRKVLEETRVRMQNLRRWERSGQARLWVQVHHGDWAHGDWLELLEELKRSSFWPLEPEAVGEVLEEIREEFQNLRRYAQSGMARKWVAAHLGHWGEADWLDLRASLQQSDLWPLDPDAVLKVLEECKVEYWNLRHWQESDQPWQWVQAHQGEWNHDDWRALLDTLRRSPYWPINPEAVGEVLGRVKAERANLHRWEQSGQPRCWVEERRGQWTFDDWLDLRLALGQSEFWPLDTAGAHALLKRMSTEHGNLRRWQQSGQGRRWVQIHHEHWSKDGWLDYLEDLKATTYWPLDPAAVGQFLEEYRSEHENLRRWQESGQPRAWAALRPGRWKPGDWHALLDSLKQSDFWPLDPDAVRQTVAALQRSSRHAA